MTTFLKKIEKKMAALDPERLTFFIRWLEDHTKLAGLAEETNRQAGLAAWFGKLDAESAQSERRLILAEIIWCAATPLVEFRRIASSEARRSLDE